jgi:hypothetical protein
MDQKAVYEGLSILMSYMDDDDELELLIQGEALLADGPIPAFLKEEDRERLEKVLGWGWVGTGNKHEIWVKEK